MPSSILMQLTFKSRKHYPTTVKYIYFSSVHRIFIKIYHILGCNTSLIKFQRVKLQSMLSKHKEIRLEINNNIFPNDSCVKKEILNNSKIFQTK